MNTSFASFVFRAADGGLWMIPMSSNKMMECTRGGSVAGNQDRDEPPWLRRSHLPPNLHLVVFSLDV